MANKKDFTKEETRYNPIAAKNTENTTNTTNTNDTKNTAKRKYERLDPRNEAPEEYRFTARMPGDYGRYLVEKAYQNRTSVTKTLQSLIEEDMKKHPEILKGLEGQKKGRNI